MTRRWHPPIPAGMLYSAPALALGPALALLLWMYDNVNRDGVCDVSLKAATDDLEIIGYRTIKLWWSALLAGPFFCEVCDRGRQGYRVTFAADWIDWRELGRDAPPSRPAQGQDVAPETISQGQDVALEAAQVPLKSISSPDEGQDVALDGRMYKVLHVYQESESRGPAFSSLNVPSPGAPAPEPLPPVSTGRTGPSRNTRPISTADPNQSHPAVAILVDLRGDRKRPNAVQAALIARTIPSDEAALARWRSIVERQLAASKGERIDWMVEAWQEETAARAKLVALPPAPMPAPAADAAPQKPPMTPEQRRAFFAGKLKPSELVALREREAREARNAS